MSKDILNEPQKQKSKSFFKKIGSFFKGKKPESFKNNSEPFKNRTKSFNGNWPEPSNFAVCLTNNPFYHE